MIRVYYARTNADGSAAARLLLDYALERDYGITDAEIAKTDKGKPCILNHPNVFISITHTHGIVAVAVSDSPVGIDCENLGELRLRVMEKMFTEDEREYVGDDPLRFYEIWTRKESYGKLTGTGLLRRMDSIDTLADIGVFTSIEITGTVATVCSYGEDTVAVHEIFEDELKRRLTMTVYKLTHRRHIEYKLHTGEPVTDDRVIGFFTSEEKAASAAESLRDKPGFSDFPSDFFIDKYELTGGSDNFVYIAEHSYYVEDDRFDNVVEIGVFCTEDDAMSAAAEYEKTARFPVGSHVWDEDFDIDNYLSVVEYSLDEICFGEGFSLE